MKANDLNISTADKTAIEQLDTTPPVAAVIKTFDSKFESFGDAMFTWMNTNGAEPNERKFVDETMVKCFVLAQGLPFTMAATHHGMAPEHYFESDAFVFKWLEEKGFLRLGFGQFFLLDECNRPIMRVSIQSDHVTNFSVHYCGAEHLMEEFHELLRANVKVDASVEKKATYAEVVLRQGSFGRGEEPGLIYGKIDNRRVALPEYYPYIEGGIEALIRDYVQSEESVLILKGPPGTGKSSGVSSVIEILGLLPIYAKRADAILHKDFVNFVFKSSDSYMENIAGTAAKTRIDLFKESLTKDREFKCTGRFIKLDEEEETRIPIIVVEDADSLLAPRSTGNLIMSELLNETDGIGSNHTRKIIFTTNLAHDSDIDEALMRPGRCYGVIDMRNLTAEEAIAARAAAGLPEFEVAPTKDMSLAVALRKPRQKIVLSEGRKATLGF